MRSSPLLSKDHFISCPVFILNVGLSHIYVSTHAALASSERHYSPLIISEKAVYMTWWVTGIDMYLNQRLLSSLPGSAPFFTVICGHSLHCSLSSLFLPFSSQSSSIVAGQSQWNFYNVVQMLRFLTAGLHLTSV